MRRLVLCLLLLAAFGCEGSNELVSPPPPTATPTPPPSYRISGTVIIATRGLLKTVTATSGGRQWTAGISSTDAHTGTYQFVGLPAGEFQVTATLPSWCGGGTKTVTIPPDATVDFAFMCVHAPDDPNVFEE